MSLLHIGLEHPNALWLVGAALLAFLAGLGVNLRRSGTASQTPDAAVSDEDAE